MSSKKLVGIRCFYICVHKFSGRDREQPLFSTILVISVDKKVAIFISLTLIR